MRAKLLIIITVFMLTGCGFQPVLARRQHNNKDGSIYLPQIRVETDRSRMGQLLKAEINDQINPRRLKVPTQYILRISTSETTTQLFINPDGTSNRGEINYNSQYSLIRAGDNEVMFQGNISRASSFNSSESADYAAYVTQEDAKKRGIIELARDYALRLANLSLRDAKSKPDKAK